MHGSEVCYRKFLNAARFYSADVLVLGGDVTGKAVIPAVPVAGGYRVDGLGGRVLAEEEWLAYAKRLRDEGSYPVVLSEEEMAAAAADPVAKDKLFTRLILERLTEWMRLAEERLAATGVRCYISPGNDDPLEIDAVLNASSYVINPEDRVVDIGEGWEMITSGYANPTPWASPRELPEEALKERILTMIRNVRNLNRCLFNLHVPPKGTPLDEAPALDADLKPIVAAGQVATAHVGSSAVRELIVEYQPPLALHGHIHESRAATRIGRTLCLNPGSEYSDGVLRGVVADLVGGRVRAYTFTDG